MTNYIVVTRNTDLWLVGPFDNNAAAADYGATAQQKLWEDDPRWHTIDLADVSGLRVDAPEDIDVKPGAYGAACRDEAPDDDDAGIHWVIEQPGAMRLEGTGYTVTYKAGTLCGFVMSHNNAQISGHTTVMDAKRTAERHMRDLVEIGMRP